MRIAEMLGFLILPLPAGMLVMWWATREDRSMAKLRYFLRDKAGKYRGLFCISEDHADRLRRKGWTVRRAGRPFRKIHPWYVKPRGEKNG